MQFRRFHFAAVVLCAVLFHTTLPAEETVPLIESKDPASGWSFNNGAEFPGATGSLTADADAARDGHESLKLVGDFTKGGMYVQAGKRIAGHGAGVDIRELSMWVRSPNSDGFTLRINDASGQTHQIKIKMESGPDWQHIVLPLERFFAHRGEADAVTTISKYESWGGAKDGAWHGPATAIYLLLGTGGKKIQTTMWLNDIEILPKPLFALPAAFKSDFEEPALARGWTVAGGVSIDPKMAFKGNGSLLLARSLDDIEKPCSASSPPFHVAPGQWEISLAFKSELNSADASYNAVVQLECLDRAGKIVERVTVADVFGKHDWQPMTKRIELPKSAVSARFQMQLNKVEGSFWIDDISAAFLTATRQKDDRISRILFSTAQLGNLLFPTDPRKVNVTIEARKSLRDNQHTMSYVVRDYWGAEQMQPATVTLGDEEKKGDRILYQATIDLSEITLEVGRYYELHATIPQENDEPFHNYTSFAILPEAETRHYKPEEIPFTSRNWDNRISEYIKLSDRLGVRICGIWGGWSAKPPYKAEAPSLDLAQQLGMGWLTTTPCATIEHGEKKYDETALRQGVHNLIEQYGMKRPMIINLGNEPHGKGERVLANVEAYRIVYEEVKKVDPTIPVVATSVEPNEEYFKAGYGKWCDAYDFHIYESAEDVRRTMGQYRDLMKKYDVVKPLWSTELGLNSQGMTRHVVAVEVIKKFSTFFAAGGVSASWFGVLYPDADGKSHGSSGDSHNIFDCRYNHYCPRLDAIAYYNGVNAIAIKKFVDEKQYADSVRAFLFRDRDNRTLQVLWKEKGQQDAFVPLADVTDVQVIRIDGSHRSLNAGGKGLTLSLTGDPLLLLYAGGAAALPEKLESPAATLDAPPKSAARDKDTMLNVVLDKTAALKPELIAPPFWEVKKDVAENPDGKSAFRFTVTPPKSSTVREADFIFKLNDGEGKTNGELYYRIPMP